MGPGSAHSPEPSGMTPRRWLIGSPSRAASTCIWRIDVKRLPHPAIFCLIRRNRGTGGQTASLDRSALATTRGVGRRAHAKWPDSDREPVMESFSGELAFMAVSASKAFLTLMEPHRLMFLG